MKKYNVPILICHRFLLSPCSISPCLLIRALSLAKRICGSLENIFSIGVIIIFTWLCPSLLKCSPTGAFVELLFRIEFKWSSPRWQPDLFVCPRYCFLSGLSQVITYKTPVVWQSMGDLISISSLEWWIFTCVSTSPGSIPLWGQRWHLPLWHLLKPGLSGLMALSGGSLARHNMSWRFFGRWKQSIGGRSKTGRSRWSSWSITCQFFFNICDKLGNLGSYGMMNLVLFTSPLCLTTFFKASDLSNVSALSIAASTTLLLYPLSSSKSLNSPKFFWQSSCRLQILTILWARE